MTGSETERLAQRGEPLTRAERLLITMFVTMFATMIAAGALAFTTLSGQLVVDMQRQTSARLLDMQKQIGALRDGNARGDRQPLRTDGPRRGTADPRRGTGWPASRNG